MKALLISLAILISIASYADGKYSLEAPQKTSYDENFLLPSGFFNINYNLGWGVGDFGNFIHPVSYRGFSIDSRWFISDRFAVGGQLGWNGFYEKYPNKTYEFDGGALTGIVTTTYYNFTMTLDAYYYPLPEAMIKPFIGIHVGPEYQTIATQIARIYDEHDSWQFIAAPEVGVFVQLGQDSDVGLNLAVKYNYIPYTHQAYDIENGLTYFQGVMGLSFMF
ncbi:MAG: hypothetical protein KAG64_08355 [Bacteroidales bacterium]|nr:hypothetical protein [Bacteroidales bacterium]